MVDDPQTVYDGGLATSPCRGKTGEGKKATETCNTWHAY